MCCGSSFYLKQQYDVGYALNLQLSTTLGINQTLQRINEVIREYVKDDSARIIGQAATEILYRISFESNQYLPSLFRHIDKNKKELNITKYAISATTLEEVFRTINEATVFSREESVTDDKDRRGSTSNSSNYNKYGQYKPVDIPVNGVKRDQEDSKQSVGSDTNTTNKSTTQDGVRKPSTVTGGNTTDTNELVAGIDGMEEEQSELSTKSDANSVTVDGGTNGGTGTANGGTTTGGLFFSLLYLDN